MKVYKMMLAAVLVFGIAFSAQAQQKDKYERVGDKVKVTRFYDDGTVKETGFYKGNAADGVWKEYNQDGTVKTEANYVNGKKDGKWLVYSADGEFLYELFYEDNKLADANRWKISERSTLANN